MAGREQGELDLAILGQIDRFRAARDVLAGRVLVEEELRDPRVVFGPQERTLAWISSGSPWVATVEAGSAATTATSFDLLGREPEDEGVDGRLEALRLLGGVGDRGRAEVPGRAGQVGQDVDLSPLELARADGGVCLDDRRIERAVGVADRRAPRPASGPGPARGRGPRRGSAESMTKTSLWSVALLEDLGGAELWPPGAGLSRCSVYSIDRLVSTTRAIAVSTSSLAERGRRRAASAAPGPGPSGRRGPSGRATAASS